MSKLFFLITLISLSAFAQNNPPRHECYRPGEILDENYLGVFGEEKTMTLEHSGKDLDGNASGEVKESFRLEKRYEIVKCVERTFYREVRRCRQIDMDEALGKGNKEFKEFFDKEVSRYRRATKFSELVNYLENSTEDRREEVAYEIIKSFDGQTEIPTSWDEFKELLQELKNYTNISLRVFEDITYHFAEENKKALGLIKLDDVTIIEGKGNKKFKSLFDESLSTTERANIIKRDLKGISSSDYTYKLARFLVNFGSMHLVNSWTKFTELLQEAADRGHITKQHRTYIVEKYAEENKEMFGFVEMAESCTTRRIPYQVNKIENQTYREYHRTVNFDYRVSVMNAPLMSGEKQRVTISHDGVARNPMVRISSSYNRFEPIQITTNFNGSYKIEIKGKERIKVAAANTVTAALRKTSTGNYSVQFVDKYFDKDYQEATFIYVDIYRPKFLSREKLGSFKLKLNSDGSVTNHSFKKSVYKNKKIYLEYRIQRLGSKYFKESQSGSRKSNRN